jgi:hypothetical protein
MILNIIFLGDKIVLFISKYQNPYYYLFSDTILIICEFLFVEIPLNLIFLVGGIIFLAIGFLIFVMRAIKQKTSSE